MNAASESSDLFSAAAAATDALANDPGFLAYVEDVKAKRREVVATESARIKKAEVLWLNYAAAMRRIGLHPLTWLEIGDRIHELRGMATAAEETDATDLTLRFHYQDRLAEAAKSDGR